MNESDKHGPKKWQQRNSARNVAQECRDEQTWKRDRGGNKRLVRG